MPTFIPQKLSSPLYRAELNADGTITLITATAKERTFHDAFDRLRTAHPKTLFDSKQLADALPLQWDDQGVSGSGTGSSHSVNQAASTLSVSNLTAGRRVRQTKRWFNYQPGKSQLILMTGVLGAGASGITRRVYPVLSR